ncbi:secretion system protein [Chlamydia sp. 17-3921]|uniref:secretion system protein n=1 Tax=Chlamydia sp. 17-3921 TaxID=2675798 RepID=UPI001917E18F|nr:secretion system protein [Chlamydia sp. 17-3921]
MSLSSSSGPDSAKNILSQVLTSTPQGVPNEDKLTGKENKQVQQTRSGLNAEMQSDVKLTNSEAKETQGIAANSPDMQSGDIGDLIKQIQEENSLSKTESQQIQELATQIGTTIDISKGLQALEGLKETFLSTLSPEENALLQQVTDIVKDAVSGNIVGNTQLETPQLPVPKLTPRKDVSEIGMALAKAIAALGESTRSAISNYLSTQAQSDASNKASLEKQGLKIDKEREEFQKMKELEAKAKDNTAMETANKVMIAVSIAVTVGSVIAGIFTCGAGFIGLAAAGALAAGAGAAAATTTVTAVATQVTIQAVIQAVKTAVVEAIKQAISQAIKIAVKQGLKAAIKSLIKTIAKVVSKAITKIFSTGKSVISKAFPNLSKVINSLSSKWVSLGISIATAVPGLVKGIGQMQTADLQQELAQIQKEVGKLVAQSEMMKMFTQFWMQASKIAAKQTGQSEEMSQQATKLGAQIGKAFATISAGLASAV